MRAAVVGHVEWTTIARVESVPHSGDVVHAAVVWEGPAGGGAVAAGQLAKLADECVFFTSLGDDDAGRRARAGLAAEGVKVVAATADMPTRRALSVLDASGERTTVTLGPRPQPAVGSPVSRGELDSFDAVYFVAGDIHLLRQARGARVLVASSRESSTVAAAEVDVDALVGSGTDPAELYLPEAFTTAPPLVVITAGASGGVFREHGGEPQAYRPVAPPGPLVDTYGVGDSFAAALTYGIGAGLGHLGALRLAACCGAACAAGRGPFEGQTSLVAS